MNKEALSLDIDGVVFSRIPFQLKAIRDYMKRGLDIYLPPPIIPIINRVINNEPLRPNEIIPFVFTAARIVFPGVRKALFELEGIDVYGNTGRPNRKPWVEMTKTTLRGGNILDQFSDIFFRPKDISTMVSKLAAIAQLREEYYQVIHVDDNPADALPIAARFPDIKVVIVQDLTTGLLLSRVEMDNYPNVRRVAVFREAVQKKWGD